MTLLAAKFRRDFYSFHHIFILIYFLFIAVACDAQSVSGTLKGQVTDGSTYRPLSNVIIKSGGRDSAKNKTFSFADGGYLLRLKKGKYSISYYCQGFQAKVISKVYVSPGEITTLNIVLYPLAGNQNKLKGLALNDSLTDKKVVAKSSFYKEKKSLIYNAAKNHDDFFDNIATENIEPGLDKNGALLLKRLQSVIVQNNTSSQGLQSLNIFGLGERYTQVQLNGSLLNTFTPLEKNYPFASLPSEIIDKVGVQKIGNSSLPADFAGGNISMVLKNFPERDFFYIQSGSGFSDKTNGQHFFSDKISTSEKIGIGNSSRDLPASFPTTRSQISFSAKSPDEQVSLSRLLKNNIAPVDEGLSKPDEKLMLGFGKIFTLGKTNRAGIIGFFSHTKSTLIDESATQAMPDIIGNPFPFTDVSKVVVHTQSKDISYKYSSHLSGVLNSSIIYGRNKISFSNFFISRFNNTYTQRSQVYKSDEDTFAHSALHYIAEQQLYFTTQLSGEHALNTGGKLLLSWHASYNFNTIKNPDERNFLLRQDPADNNKFEIAHVSAPPFSPIPPTSQDVFDPNLTNTGRLWRNLKDNNFEGAVNISSPFNLFHQPQVISGSVFIQSRNRIFFSDLLPTKGEGYYTLSNLIAPGRYYAGGLTVTNYYKNFGGSFSYVYANNRANYTASANTGSSYIRFESKLSKNLSADLGARAESATQLVSNTQYNYVASSTAAVRIPLDKNIYVNRVDFLPSVNIQYLPVNYALFHAAWFKTLNRPQLQELTNYRYYDPLSFMVKIGNPILQPTSITNYDAGITLLHGAVTSFSISGFYKNIDQPIEYIVTPYTSATVLFQPHNTPQAKVYGLNIAFKMKLNKTSANSWLSDFSIFGNGNWLTSKVKEGPVRKFETPFITHTLSGSPDYAINAGLVFQAKSYPSITILYNRTDDYMSALGSGKNITLANGNIVQETPAYFVKGNEQLDVHVSQKLFKFRLQLTAGANNILDNPYIVYQDLNGNKKFDEPLSLKEVDGKEGFYQSGTDNTVAYVKSQRTYYVTLSWLFAGKIKMSLKK